jgi:endonuclease/exonuclease/phosphatase family metal-dependent hydrolase
MGNLLIYGTIVGIYGNRHPSFDVDLTKQLGDLERLSARNANLCVIGDFNCTFADNYYYTKSGRNALLQSFADNRMALLTKDTPECIDHIAVSKRFVEGCTFTVEEWNCDKQISDHKGITVNITKNGGIIK